MKEVVIIGATGFVGGYVVDAILEAGHKVSVVARTPAKAADMAVKGVRVVQGDVHREKSLEAAFKGAQVVVNLVGIIRESPGASFEQVHSKGAANVAEAAYMVGAERIIYMSALGAWQGAMSRYQKTKWRGEEYVRECGVPFVIFNPAVIFGPGDEFITRLAGFFKYPLFVPVIGSGKSLMQPVYVKDVARCFALAVDEPAAENRDFALAGPRRYTVPQILDAIGTVLNKKRIKVHLPLFLMRPAAALMQKFLKSPPLTTDQLIMLGVDNIEDAKAAKKIFNMEFAALEDIIPGYIKV